MSVNASSHWMDRVRATPTPTKPSNPYWSVPLHSLERGSREIIAARAALRGRAGITQEHLYLLARDRRSAVLKTGRPARGLLAIGLVAAGIAISVTGSLTTQQFLLLSGFGIAFAGLVVGCVLLAGMMDPQTGDLAKYVHEDESPASADEIALLVRDAQADPELGSLIRGWWKESGAPIRRQDLDLVRAFQQARGKD
jgi:hypothetical protein